MSNSEKSNLPIFNIIVILFIVSVVYVTFLSVPPYIDHYMLDKEVASEITFAHKRSDEGIRRYIFNKAQGMDVPIEAKDIEIRRTGKQIEILIEYWIDLDFAGLHQKELYFDIYHTETIQAGGRYSPRY